ncbi:hypothetical protein H4582DRAFT_1087490 [Lactarius indigo]|nr:hypothetical protein H4582DRAFT_1087490 [Lactarius indigo]
MIILCRVIGSSLIFTLLCRFFFLSSLGVSTIIVSYNVCACCVRRASMTRSRGCRFRGARTRIYTWEPLQGFLDFSWSLRRFEVGRWYGGAENPSVKQAVRHLPPDYLRSPYSC